MKKKNIKIVFFGTPSYVLPVVDRLHKEFRTKEVKSPIVAVVTQPPKPTGRKGRIEYSPVDQWAYRKKIPIFFDPKELIAQKITAEIGIIASFGQIIPKEVIDHFPHGILNIHFSLLPKFRGASPVHAAIVTGEKEIGVTIFKIDEKLDHGPIISQFKEEILPDDTVASICERLFPRSAEVLTTLLPAYLKGEITPRKQDDSKASYTRVIKKDDAFIPPEFIVACLQGTTLKVNWEIPFIKVDNQRYNLQPTSYNLFNFIRAMQPWPIAWTLIKPNTKSQKSRVSRLKILKAHIEPITPSNNMPTATKLVLDEVQLEGKKPVAWEQFRQGYPDAKFI